MKHIVKHIVQNNSVLFAAAMLAGFSLLVSSGGSTLAGDSPALEPHICTFILKLVPRVDIDEATENPEKISGFGQLANPNAPESPYNKRKICLSVANPNKPYNKVWNGLVYVAGCPIAGSTAVEDKYWRLRGNTGTTDADFLGTTEAQPLIVKTDNTERMRVDPAGNVGIGLTAPSYRLHVLGRPLSNNSGSAGFFELSQNGRSETISAINANGLRGDEATVTFWALTDGPLVPRPPSYRLGSVGGLAEDNAAAVRRGALVFRTSAGPIPPPPAGFEDLRERMRITSEGDVGIGTSTPRGRLDVLGDVPGGASAIVNNESTGGPEGTSIGLWVNSGATLFDLLGYGRLGVLGTGIDVGVRGQGQTGVVGRGETGVRSEGNAAVVGDLAVSGDPAAIVTTLTLSNASGPGVRYTMASLGGGTSLGRSYQLGNPDAVPDPGDPPGLHGNPALTVDADNNAAIGSPFPAAKLHVYGGASKGTSLLIESRGSVDLIRASDVAAGRGRFAVRRDGSVLLDNLPDGATTACFVDLGPASSPRYQLARCSPPLASEAEDAHLRALGQRLERQEAEIQQLRQELARAMRLLEQRRSP